MPAVPGRRPRLAYAAGRGQSRRRGDAQARDPRPAGRGDRQRLPAAGFGQVAGVRQGKRFEVELSEPAGEADRVAAGVAELGRRAAGQPGDRGVLGPAAPEHVRLPADVLDWARRQAPLTATGTATVRPEIARVHDYRGPSGKPSQCGSLICEVGGEERMRISGDSSRRPAADARFCLVFPRETLSVPVMRRVLGDTLDRLGVDEECVADLLLAVTEACTNVLRHSGPGRRYEVVAQVGQQPLPARGRRQRPRLRPGQRCRRHRRSAAFGPPGSGGSRRHRPRRAPPRARRLGHAAQPHARSRRQRGGAGPGRAARVRPGPGDHAGLRRRRDAAHRPGRGTVVSLHKRIELAQRRAAGAPRAGRAQLQGRRLQPVACAACAGRARTPA